MSKFFRRLCLSTIVVAGSVLASSPASAQELPCGPEEIPGTARAELDLVRVNGRSATTSHMQFKDRRGNKRITYEYSVEGCTFRRADIGDNISIRAIEPTTADNDELDAEFRLSAKVMTPQSIEATYAVDPDDDTDQIVPGEYAGGFVMDDDRIALLREPVEISLGYGNRTMLFLTLLIPGVVFGTFFIWFKGRAGGSREAFWKWFKPANLIAIAIGTAAGVAYFQANVVDQTSFGADLVDRSLIGWVTVSEWWGAALALGSAFTTAALGGSLLGDARRGGTSPEDGAVPVNGTFPGKNPLGRSTVA